MNMIAEELLRTEKYKELENRFSNIRKGLKISLNNVLKENLDYAKMIEKYAAVDVNPLLNSGRSFFDELGEIAKLMKQAFDVGDVEEGALAHKLARNSVIYIERIGQASVECKNNHFAFQKEKFNMNVSEEQEVKSLIPRNTFRNIKNYITKWTYLFSQYSVNAKARVIYQKLVNFRDTLLEFEYNYGKNLSLVSKDYLKEVLPFIKEAKLALLRLRKLCEAIEASQFGSITKLLYSTVIEEGTRVFVNLNEFIYVRRVAGGEEIQVPLQGIVEKYDNVMFPIRQTLAELDAKVHTQRNKDEIGLFWNVSSNVLSFKTKMQKVIDKFSFSISPNDEDVKFFTFTVQSIIIPYMSQMSGKVNDTFINSIKNLDTFFWRIIVRAIERSLDNKIDMDQLLGLSVKITKRELDAFKEKLRKEHEELLNMENAEGFEGDDQNIEQ